jgi:hypothetical protein
MKDFESSELNDYENWEKNKKSDGKYNHFIVILILLVLALLVPFPTKAQTVGLHTISYHDPDPHHLANNENWGIYGRFENGVGCGFYKNTLKRDSVHIDYTTPEFYRLRGTMGFMNGYSFNGSSEWVPFYMVSIHVITIKKSKILLGFVTDGEKNLYHLMIERTFK